MSARKYLAWTDPAAAEALAALAADEPVSWMDLARCTDTDPDLWFAEKGGSADTRLAKRICLTCEARLECLEYAMADPGLLGVWGGLTYLERQVLRREVAA